MLHMGVVRKMEQKENRVKIGSRVESREFNSSLAEEYSGVQYAGQPGESIHLQVPGFFQILPSR